jgi:hypothetical protein
MEQIIQQTIQNFTTQIFERIRERGLGDLGQAAQELLAMATTFTAQVITASLKAMDQALCEANSLRRENQLVVQERNVPREVMTAVGVIHYERTYFNDRAHNSRVYLLDHLIGVEPYERISPEVSARLVNQCTALSYARSAQVQNVQVCRQTVRNKMMQTRELAFIPERSQVTPDTLHIFADEDHVHLQNGRGVMVPLVVIAQGVTPVCKGRNALNEPMFVQGYKLESDRLWEHVYALIATKYDVDAIRKIYLHGDGAAWILTGLDYLPNSEHVLDKYHFLAKMKSLLAGSYAKRFSRPIWDSIRAGDLSRFKETADTIIAETLIALPGEEGVTRVNRLKETVGYIVGHWAAILTSRLSDMLGSCTEPMVSHVLSERFSRNPMGWSDAGLSHMSMLRIYTHNHCTILPDDLRSSIPFSRSLPSYSAYDKLALDKCNEVLSSPLDWSLFQSPSLQPGKLSGTSVLLHALGKLRSAA